jgi:RND family efflux transporter MFP subunit
MLRMVRPVQLMAFMISIGAATAMAAAGEHDCMIMPRQQIEIRSPVEAMIESIKVRRGDVVAKGQVIATLESGPERAALALAQSRASMQGEIKVVEARLDLAEKKLKRAEELAKQNFISQNARDEAQAEFRLATEELRRARENQQLAEFEAKRAAEVLALRTIRSPFTGVVTEVLLKPGEFGATTIKDPIMRLAEIDVLNVEVILPGSMRGSVKLGQRATVAPEGQAAGRYQTTVSVVDPVTDAASGTFGVQLMLPNPKRSIPAGVKCRVSFS